MARQAARDRASSDVSSDDENDVIDTARFKGKRTAIIDGKKCIIIETGEMNGDMVNGIPNGDPEPEAIEPIDPKDVGMTLGFRNLYSGKEDKRGNYTWQSTPPTDLGKPAEDAETAKWAIIVRNKRVYGDPRKVLAIHSK